MERSVILREIKRYFNIRELVCDHTYKKYNEGAWFLIPTFWLHTLLILRRDILQKPLICNNYSSPNGNYKQRGTRCNLCQIVKDETASNNCYQSAHTKNIGNDFTVVGMVAPEARNKIAENKELLPYPVRLERNVTWLHIDGYDNDNGQKITYF